MSQVITSAVAPIVMVSAAGLLAMGVQAKNLHLADRVRALTIEYRARTADPAQEQRRDQIVVQLALFRTRLSLSQRALECIYLALVTFVLTSLVLAATPWLGGAAPPVVSAGVFVLGVVLLLVALTLEFWEMHLGLRTVDAEIGAAMKKNPLLQRRRGDAGGQDRRCAQRDTCSLPDPSRTAAPRQTVAVIGGTSGIGLETARRARAEPAHVVLTGRNTDASGAVIELNGT